MSLWICALLAATPPLPAQVEPLFPELEKLYLDLHRSPELSHQEVKTAQKLAAALKRLGFEVTQGVGGTGVVGVLKNGAGPRVMLRADLDGLPIVEKTGLPYASKVRVKDSTGAEVGAMHACGHDVHMASWVGAATLLSRLKGQWKGTLMMVGQPAEEVGAGAKAMLAAGLFDKGNKPDHAVMIHATSEFPAGAVATTPGYLSANVDSVDITVFGRGGHGSTPHRAVDPVVIAARTVVALQALVSREQDPLEPAVVTVGSIHGGTKHNIIPDEVKLQLTVRSYSDAVRARLLESIRRVARAEALAGNAPREPLVTVEAGPASVFNDPKVTERLTRALTEALGPDQVHKARPVMGGEDFSEYGRAGVPSAMIWVGAVEPGLFAQARAAGTPLPTTHSALFAPDYGRALRTGTLTLTAAALELFGPPGP